LAGLRHFEILTKNTFRNENLLGKNHVSLLVISYLTHSDFRTKLFYHGSTPHQQIQAHLAQISKIGGRLSPQKSYPSSQTDSPPKR